MRRKTRMRSKDKLESRRIWNNRKLGRRKRIRTKMKKGMRKTRRRRLLTKRKVRGRCWIDVDRLGQRKRMKMDDGNR